VLSIVWFAGNPSLTSWARARDRPVAISARRAIILPDGKGAVLTMVNTFTREVLKPFSVTRSHTQAGARSPGSGVGIVFKVSDTGLMHVKELSPGGAASESKQIKIFDQLISINNEGITGKTLDEVTQRVLGLYGSRVCLGLRRRLGNGSEMKFEVSLIRGKKATQDDQQGGIKPKEKTQGTGFASQQGGISPKEKTREKSDAEARLNLKPSAPPWEDVSFSATEQQCSARAFPLVNDARELTVLQELTSGSYKTVSKAQWSPSGAKPRIVALLVPRFGYTLRPEKDTFEKLGRHPYLTQLLATTASRAGQACLITEFAEHGSVDMYLRQQEAHGVVVTSEVLLTAASQICDGMAQLALYDVIHRELAARNVLVFQMHPSDHRLVTVKITDYGLAVHGSCVSTNQQRLSTKGEECVPVRWTAPEAIAHHRYNQQSDVFSFGVMMWELWEMGAVPWADYLDPEVAQLLKQGKRLDQPEACPDEVFSIMKACWADNPSRRPPFLSLRTQLQDALKQVSAAEQGPTCVVCLTRAPSMALFPCRHRCLCASADCQKAIRSKCPICRLAVDSIQKIYDCGGPDLDSKEGGQGDGRRGEEERRRRKQTMEGRMQREREEQAAARRAHAEERELAGGRAGRARAAGAGAAGAAGAAGRQGERCAGGAQVDFASQSRGLPSSSQSSQASLQSTPLPASLFPGNSPSPLADSESGREEEERHLVHAVLQW